MDQGLYDWPRRVENMRRTLKKSDILPKNKKAISDFIAYKRSEVEHGKPISLAREVKYLSRLRLIAEEIDKPFKDLTEADVKALLGKLYKKPVMRGAKKVEPSQATKADIAIILKTFLTHIWGGDESKTDFIAVPSLKIEKLRDEDRLDWEDIITLSRAALNQRDHAFIQVLFESGCRIEECLTCLVRDAAPIENGRAYRLNIRKSKTEIRPITLIVSAPALHSWLQNHPLKNRTNFQDQKLWITIDTKHGGRNQPLNYPNARKLLLDLRERTTLKKKVNPHSLRKSSASFFAGILNDSDLKARYGWTPDSKMLRVYVNRDQRAVEEKLLIAYGLKTNGQHQESIKPQTCPVCGEVNAVHLAQCSRCRSQLGDPERVLIQEHGREVFLEASKQVAEERPEFKTMLYDRFSRIMNEKIERTKPNKA